MSVAYEVVIGVEVHAQLRTQSKLFCPCGTTFGRTANSQTCPVCLGLPGSLPVINEKAVEMAVRAGLAMNGTIGVRNRFARKNYFYPDLPKGYQISQYEAPICEHGWIEIAAGGTRKRVRIRRAHLEEDAGKNVHEAGSGMSLVDLNRAGTPLLEIVTEPDLSSSEEVVAYLKALRELLMYLDVCDGNMEEGSFRCEPNLSLRPVGQAAYGTKVELKNINSFKFVKDAVEYEIKRQTKVLSEGGKVYQETRLWNHERGETAVMRSKEEAHDYRYFPDPDLVPLEISVERIGNNEGKTLKNRYTSFGAVLENRFYLGSEAPRGFYLAPYARYNHFGLARTATNDESQYSTTFKGSVNGVGLGGALGFQFRMGDHVTMDVTLIGLDLKWMRGTLTYSSNDPNNDIAQLRDEVQAAVEDIPLIGSKLSAAIDGDQIKVHTPGATLPGYRFNLAVNYVF